MAIRRDGKRHTDPRATAARTGMAGSGLAREASGLRPTLARFEDLRRGLVPFAETCGWLTDEDVFEEIS